MSAGGFTVIDGTQLRSLSQPLALPTSDSSTVTGAQLLDFAENEASSSLFGLSLPQNLKSTALKHISGSDDDVTFRIKEFDRDHASKLASDYITAIADELKDDPLVVCVLDGNMLKLFLGNEDDFTMLAENLFADLDTEDEGKVCKGEIQNALGHMGVEFGVPPFSEFPQLNDILKKHGAEGEEELGQAQFTELLRQVLQDIVDALADKRIIIIPNIKIIDGSKLRMVSKMLSTKMKAQLQCREQLFRMMDTWDMVYLLTKSDFDDFIPMRRFYIEEGGRREIVGMMSTIGLSECERDDIMSEVQTIGRDRLLSVEEEAYQPSEPAAFDHWTTSKERASLEGLFCVLVSFLLRIVLAVLPIITFPSNLPTCHSLTVSHINDFLKFFLMF